MHDAMRAERPNAKFAGFTDVKELAEAIAGVWDRPAAGSERNPPVADAATVTSEKTDAGGHHDPEVRGFASDNYAGVHPEVLAALALANGGHQVAYGEDDYTEHLQSVIRSHFGPTAEAFPVFNGTGANVVALQAVTDRWGAVICAESAHIHVDEGGAPERVGGLKLLTVPTEDGKLTPELIDRRRTAGTTSTGRMPQVVSITQNTELGTVYTPDEIRAICEHAHELGMRVHLDGARIANAAAVAGRADARVHQRAPGWTSCPSAAPRTALLLRRGRRRPQPGRVSAAMQHLRKLSMQLASKMRFVSVQLEALLARDLWLRNARHANAMAQRLAAGVREVDGVRDPVPGAGQRGLRPAAARGERAAAEALPLLLLGRGGRRRALDVLFRHHRGRRRRIPGRTPGGDGQGVTTACLCA